MNQIHSSRWNKQANFPFSFDKIKRSDVRDRNRMSKTKNSNVKRSRTVLEPFVSILLIRRKRSWRIRDASEWEKILLEIDRYTLQVVRICRQSDSVWSSLLIESLWINHDSFESSTIFAVTLLSTLISKFTHRITWYFIRQNQEECKIILKAIYTALFLKAKRQSDTKITLIDQVEYNIIRKNYLFDLGGKWNYSISFSEECSSVSRQVMLVNDWTTDRFICLYTTGNVSAFNFAEFAF